MEKFEVKNIWFELTCKNEQKDAFLRFNACLKDFGLMAYDIDILPLNEVSLTYIRFRIPIEYAKRYRDILISLHLHFMAYEEE